MTPPAPTTGPSAFRLVTLTRGMYAKVDREDYEIVSQYKWYATPGKITWYAKTSAWDNTVGRSRSISMHRLLLDAQPGQLVDHANHDGLDNRRANIRLATNSQNTANSSKKRKAARYRGLGFNNRLRRWQVYVEKDGYCHYCGSYKNDEEAAKAYDQKAVELFGEFATLNFPNSYP